MSDFKEFQGKTLDDAIYNACDYFNTEREKLEIEILEDAKSGVFGFIGARKARISARKVTLSNITEKTFRSSLESKPTTPPATLSEKPSQEAKPQAKKESSQPKKEAVQPKKEAPQLKKEEKVVEKQEEKTVEKKVEKKAFEKKEDRKQSSKAPRNNEQKRERPAPKAEQNHNPKEDSADNERFSLANIDENLLLETGKTVLSTLCNPIADSLEIDASIKNDRLCMAINAEDSGLLIGKEGQTLASIEYLAARIISKAVNSHVRVQIEVGDYRSRQDNRLNEFALILADRVRTSGKSSSTRPLSAYQRRIVHLALQEMPDIQTRSVGEGALKRVIISRVKQDRRS